MIDGDDNMYNDKEKDLNISASTIAMSKSVEQSVKDASIKFSKPTNYDRKVIDDGSAKRNLKVDAFNKNVEVRDPYTGQKLVLTKAEAKLKYGEDWAKHLAESDHIIPLEKRYEQTKNNPWLTNEDIKKSSNSSENMEVLSRKYNNAKRSKTNKEFVSNNEYLEKTGVELSEEGKKQAVINEEKARQAMRKQDFKNSARNVIETGHNAGVASAKVSGITSLTVSGINNMVSLIKGEKSVEDAFTDLTVDVGKSAITGYITGNGLTTITHTLANSSSKFIKALADSNMPAKVVTSVMVIGDTLGKYFNGNISTQECLLELGEKGLNFVTTGYSMAVGQCLIPIPIVGAAVGAFVGSVLTSNYYNQLIGVLKRKDLEHKERLRIIEECERSKSEMRSFREELEKYLESYLKDYRDCFDDAIYSINESFKNGDADGVILGANKITKKLGGNVQFNSVEEFKSMVHNKQTFYL